MIDILKTKYVFAFYNSFLKIELNCDKENHVNFKYTCSFQKKMSNLACMIWSLAKCVLEDGFKDHHSISPLPFLLGDNFQSQILKRWRSEKNGCPGGGLKISCHGYLPGGGAYCVSCQKRLLKIKYGFEGSISNAALDLF